MKKITVILAIFALIFCAGCEKKGKGIQTSVFIEDKDNIGLPSVTEWGYNYWGTYVYQDGVRSILTGTSSALRQTDNDICVEFEGTSSGNINSIAFVIKDINDVYSLDGKVLDLADKNTCSVRVNASDIVNVDEGFIKFSRVNYVFYNGVTTAKTLCCGEFGFSGKYGNSVNIKMDKGRFDMINDR